MKSYYLALVFLVIIFMPGFFHFAFADNATPINSSLAFNDIGDATFVKFTTSFFSTTGNYSCPFVCPNYSNINFTGLAVSSKTNPPQTFGVKSQISNVSLTNIDSNNVYFTVTPKNSSNPNIFYYFLTNVPPQVIVNLTSVPQTNYLLNPALYPPCKTNCVLQTSTYLEIKALGTSSNNIVVCTIMPCLNVEPAGSTDLLLLLLAIIIALIMLIIGFIYKHPLPTFIGAMVLLLMYLGLNSNPTIVYGSNSFLSPSWFNEVLILFIVIAFVAVFYQIFQRRRR